MTADRDGPRHRNERIPIFRTIRAGPIRQFVVQGLNELLDLLLHGLHLLPHVQNDLDPGEIHAEVPGEMENDFEPVEILIGIEARIAVAAAGLD